MLVSESLTSFLNEEFLVQEILNERISINSIKSASKKALILALLFLSTTGKDLPINEPKEEVAKNPLITALAVQNSINFSEIEGAFKNLFDYYKEDSVLTNRRILQDPLTMTISSEGLDFIKKHEDLSLKAYDLGDGTITIGYGHSTPKEKSKYKIGHRISPYKAEILFANDVKKAEEGVRRSFEIWKKRGVNIKVSQGMWDSMVSLAFNMGVGGFRSSDVAKHLKENNHLKAASSILSTGIKTIEKHPGLKNRREEEKELFLKDFITAN